MAGIGLFGLGGVGTATANPAATTVHVDGSVSAGDGSQSSPFPTIQEGVAHANPGDTVVVAAGTYSGVVSLTEPITLEADGHVVHQGQPNVPLDAFEIRSSDVTIRGFHFQETYFGIWTDWGSRQNIVVENNSMSDAIRGFSFSGCRSMTVRNNTFTDCGEGVHFNSVSNGTIEGNEFIGNTHEAVHLRWTQDVTVTRNTIENETVGISFYVRAEGHIYDNYVATPENIHIRSSSFYENQGPTLYVTPAAGPNILGGPRIGGNYWSNPSGTGFSDTASDTNGDGFADEPYVTTESHTTGATEFVDHYPLVEPPSHIELGLDVKPDSEENTINPNSKGVTPVTVYSTADFDATTLDVSTLRFGSAAVVDAGDGASAAHGGHVEESDGDGLADLVLHFSTPDAGFVAGDTEAKLVGQTGDGTQVVGTDSVTTVDGSGKRGPQSSKSGGKKSK
ncbi:right-handed parallel beta-helix repeat-containing protein [Haloarchaeobius sp. TZWWS8]|uniref:right-handed parallel beta-helix repeat-containing protein n=1 Tax=Haloarchaeobius sp. TZWWS8 TaxID=3446121 RepID=UPI003EBDD88D